MFGETAPRSLVLHIMVVGHGICSWGLESRDLGPPAVNPDTYLS